MEKFAQELKLFPALVLVSPRGSAWSPFLLVFPWTVSERLSRARP